MSRVKDIFSKHPFVAWLGSAFLLSLLLDSIGVSPNRAGVWIWAIALIFSIFQTHKNGERNSEARLEQLRNEVEIYVGEIKKNKSLTSLTPSIFLGQGEHLFLQEENTKLFETRAVRHSGGGFSSVRVMKGMRIGGYSGRSESTQEWRTLDSGKLFATSQKIVFVGRKENRTISLRKIISVDTFKDSIRIYVDGRAKSLMFPVRNPYLWSTVINILKSVKDPLNIGDLNFTLVLK